MSKYQCFIYLQELAPINDVIGHIKRQSALSVKKTLDLISEKYGNTLLPEAASIEEVANDETVPDLLADEMDYSGKSVVLDEGEYVVSRSQGVLWAVGPHVMFEPNLG